MDKKTVEHLESLIGENASLRALLVEARDWILSVGGSVGGFDDAFLDRIDAALAEPTHNKGKA